MNKEADILNDLARLIRSAEKATVRPSEAFGCLHQEARSSFELRAPEKYCNPYIETPPVVKSEEAPRFGKLNFR